MKSHSILAIAAFACCSAFAQTPGGPADRTSPEVNPSMSGGIAAERAEAKKDAKIMGGSAHANWRTMDANKDGMVSQAEYMAYHTDGWKKMQKPGNSNSMMSLKDMEAIYGSAP